MLTCTWQSAHLHRTECILAPDRVRTCTWLSTHLHPTECTLAPKVLKVNNTSPQNRAGQPTAEQARPEGCRKGRLTFTCSPSARPDVQSASPPCYAVRWPALLRRPPARRVVLPAGSPFCTAQSPSGRRKFMFFIWKHGPPARPVRRLVISFRGPPFSVVLLLHVIKKNWV